MWPLSSSVRCHLKSLATRAVLFGSLTSAAIAGIAVALVLLSGWSGVESLSWPFSAFLVSGAPLSMLLEWVPAYEAIQWRLFPEGGPGPVLVFAWFNAVVTWALICTTFWWVRLSKRRVAPNYSLKRTNQSRRD